MAAYCDVALPVPLDRTFTYALHGGGTEDGAQPAVGGRVLVPFSGQRLMGVVVRVHDDPPPPGVEVKPVQQVLDSTALINGELMRLAHWIATYYVAPLGEVLRGMLPLSAEVRKQFVYSITDAGRRILYEAAQKGSSRRSKLSPEDQDREYSVLNYLEDGKTAKQPSLRSATGADKALLTLMLRKKWIMREALAEQRDARRMERIAVLVADARIPALNANQTAILAELAAAGGQLPTRALRELQVPESTLGTLVKRGLVHIKQAPEAFHIVALDSQGKKQAHEHALNEPQIEALSSIAAALSQGKFKPLLLHGVTGSGKTAVYIAAMQHALDRGKSALMLVPEIGLTPAMAGQMYAAFGTRVALLHSALTPDERAEQWHRIRRGDAPIVVGTRSAVFAPLPQIGIIVVDEEHDTSYKQEETPRYHGRDVAVIRAKLIDAVIVLGSATPSLESWRNGELGRYQRIDLPVRVANRPLPQVELVDMRTEFRETGHDEIFSRELQSQTKAALERGEQVIILLNRRGYSFSVLCRACGERIECENCAIPMTYHKPAAEVFSESHAIPGGRLQCHYCGFRRTVPARCPHCESEHLHYFGAGSQQGEERLQALFPNARIGRMDRDTVRGRSDMERLLTRLHSGEINLLVGTQMIAKGHDIHGVTLVGVVGADFALGLPDFRAAERVFQLLTQVSGRAGRGELPGRVLVQTYHPEHYAVRFAADHDYIRFAEKECEYRRWMNYPPFSVLANVVVQGETLEQASHWAQILGRWFSSTPLDKIRVLGPAPAPIARLKRIYRFHFVMRGDHREGLRRTLCSMLCYAQEQGIPRSHLVVDVDPVQMM